MSQKTVQNYNQLKAKLDDLITKMESTDIDLDDATTAYEQGLKLIKQLNEHLKSAQNKIEILNKKTK